jgi:hypothetical protein
VRRVLGGTIGVIELVEAGVKSNAVKIYGLVVEGGRG